ncbi:MAG: sensor histidine kinase, partial [Gorillibacterium sp.]|nr:sensor histidine kinase [Gorillibacterium sp.]
VVDRPVLLLLVLRVFILIIILFEIVMRSHFSVEVKALFIVGILIIQANDFCRYRFPSFFAENRRVHDASIVASIAGIGLYMIQFDNLGTEIYFVFPIVELFLYSSKIKISLLVFHVMVFLSTMYALKTNIEASLFSYSAMLLLVYLFRSNSLQKKKGDLLNVELLEANAKLKEITIVKERTRIAQELHDSIGHSLIALRMHLEYAEHVVDSNPQKSREVITKALAISQTSITDLRKAVAVLKNTSLKERMQLHESLNEMIESIQMTGRLKFDLHFDKAVEQASLDIKKGIYNTVREAVTNGLKHGRAQTFHIEINRADHHTIRVVVENDGEACEHIKKSHGLHGIEDRIESLAGTVRFSSAQDCGFTVVAEIPYVTETGMI